MKLTVLDSGSRANGYVLQNGTEALVIECGCSVQSCLEVLGYRSDKVVGCLISHGHGDHSRYADSYLERFRVCCSAGTASSLKTDNRAGLTVVSAGNEFSLGGFRILPFETEHDCEEPLGYLVRHEEIGTLLFATDTYYLRYRFSGLNHILIECNYDEGILSENIEKGDVPVFVLNRVRRSHMSLETLVKTLRANDLSKVVEIVLLHISKDNGDADRFQRIIESGFGIRTFVAHGGLELEITKDKLI